MAGLYRSSKEKKEEPVKQQTVKQQPPAPKSGGLYASYQTKRGETAKELIKGAKIASDFFGGAAKKLVTNTVEDIKTSRDNRIAKEGTSQSTKKTATADSLIKERDEKRKEQGVPKVIRRALTGVDKVLYKSPVGKQITGVGQGALTSTTGLAPESVGTPSVGSKASKTIGAVLGPLANPAMVPGGVNAPYSAPITQTIAGKAGSLVSKPAASRIVTEATRESVAGVPISVGQSLMVGESDPRKLAENALLGAGIGAAGGAALRGAGELIESGVKRLRGANRATSDVPGVTNTAPEATQPSGTLPTPQEVKATTAPARTGERKFIQTLEQSDKLTPETRQGLERSNERFYDQITNAGTVDKANRRIAANIDEAEAFALNSSGRTNADQIATGMQLINEFQKRGQFERAVTVAENLSNKLTEAGQTVQAASMWNRLTPEGALIYAQRKVKAINDNLNKFQSEVKLTPKDADNITQAAGAIQAAGASQERSAMVMNLMNKVERGENLTDAESKVISDFIEDANRFVKKKKVKATKEVDLPDEIKDVRKRDKILSYLEKEAEEARKKWNAKRNLGFVRKLEEPDIVLLAKMGAYQFAKGAVKLADFTEAMVKEFGEIVRPYSEEIYKRASNVVTKSSRHISEGKIEKARQVAKKISEQSSERQAQQEAIQELANAVKKAIEDTKSGSIERDAVDKIREMSQEIMENHKPAEPMSEESRYLRAIKSLAKKLSDVETEKVDPTTAEREVKRILQTLSNIDKEHLPPDIKAPLDSGALDDLAYNLVDRYVPSQSEKVALSYLKKNEDKLTPSDIALVRDMAQQVSSLSGEAKRLASQDLQEVLNSFEKVGIGRKLSSAQYITMLLNPKTQIRNVVGNELMYRLERLARLLATPIDIVVSKVTGGPRTITFKRGPRLWENFFDSDSSKSLMSRLLPQMQTYGRGLIEGGSAGWRGVNPEGVQSKYDIVGQAFRSKLNPLTYLEKTLGATLKGFDYAAYNRAVNQRLSEMSYLDALNNGVKGADNIRSHMQTYLANLDDNIANIAKKYGDYVTLQDASFLSRSLSGFKRGLNKITTGSKDFGAGNLVVPFAKTPANILLRAIDYSPAGILKAIGQTYQTIAKKDTDLTRADVIESVSRSIFGTGIGAMAWWLADKGVIRGQASKDKDVRNLENQLGLKEFQLNGSALMRMMNAIVSGNSQDIDESAKLQPGDVQWSYSWAQPASVPVAIGSNIAQSTKEGSSGLQTAAEGAWSGLNTILDTSVLSGIQQAFQTNPGEDNTVKAIAMNLLKQVPSMFTPSIVNQVNQLIDNKTRETYSPDWMEAWLNPSQSKIPGLAQDLPQRVGTFGQGLTRSNTFFDVFFNPSDRTKYEPTPEARFVIDLLKETGDERVAPRTATKAISGKEISTGENKKIKLTGEQYTRLQSIIGQDLAQRINKINPNLPTDKKIQAVIRALDESGKKGRNVLKSELGLRKEK